MTVERFKLAVASWRINWRSFRTQINIFFLTIELECSGGTVPYPARIPRTPLTAPPLPDFCRRPGSMTNRFTGRDISETSENLTAICIRVLRETRGRTDLYQARRKVARECRKLRNINAYLCYGA